MKLYYYKHVDQDLYYVVQTDYKESEITCKIFKVDMARRIVIQFMTFKEFLVNFKNLDSQWIPANKINELNEIVAVQTTFKKAVSSCIISSDVLMLEFLKSVCNYSDLPNNSSVIADMSRVVANYLYPNAEVLSKQMEVISEFVDINTINNWKYRATEACLNRGFERDSIEWKSLFILAACRYHCGGWQDPLY